jgi:Cdc6-like AAA superfamily ATPase
LDVLSQSLTFVIISPLGSYRLLTACLDSEFRKVFKWLSTWNFWSRQQDIFTQRVGETCAWFLETPEFIQWKSDTARFLHCYGPPGIGKTVLTSVIVHHLQSTIPMDSRVIAFFCDNTTKSGYTTLLGALLQQLTKDKCSNWNGMKALYEQHVHGAKPRMNCSLSYEVRLRLLAKSILFWMASMNGVPIPVNFFCGFLTSKILGQMLTFSSLHDQLYTFLVYSLMTLGLKSAHPHRI